jgi:hypothetical protein
MGATLQNVDFHSTRQNENDDFVPPSFYIIDPTPLEVLVDTQVGFGYVA